MTRAETIAEAVIAKLDEPAYVLAAEVRIGPSGFGRIIQGRQVPTPDQARRIAERLGVAADTLFGAREAL
ncbi:MAG: helix-turn-helix domain-containing protein [Solirubrobacteraceae bacterium]